MKVSERKDFTLQYYSAQGVSFCSEIYGRTVDEYDAICEKALGTPTSTEQLFALKEELEKIKEKNLPVMDEEVLQLLRKFMFIIDYTQLSPVVTKLMTQAAQWQLRMPTVFEEHETIIVKKMVEFQEALKVTKPLILNDAFHFYILNLDSSSNEFDSKKNWKHIPSKWKSFKTLATWRTCQSIWNELKS